jgi:hypothetical protein
MALTITKTGPFFTTVGSAISFSALRNNFTLKADGSISASVLLRDTIPSQSEPIVPDATENSGISSTRNNLSLSQFRNSIKYYNITHSGTETNYNITGSINWNGNLNKTIIKSVYLTGTYGSLSASSPAATFEGDTQNVRLYVSGSVIGAGGASGSGNGGDALRVNSTTGAVTVIPTNTSRIYGGGGGGAKGSDGIKGLNGACSFYSYYDAAISCGSDPVCGSDFLNSKTADGTCNCVTTVTDVWYEPPSPPYYAPPEPYYPPVYVPFVVVGFQPTACPDPEMPILMADGTEKRAGDLQVGDFVLTQHEKTFEWGKYQVSYAQLDSSEKYKLIFTHLSGDEKFTKEVIVSESHSFHVKNDKWKNIWELEVGDVIEQYTLISSEKIGQGLVVRIEIEDAHTYVCCGFLSHNISKFAPPIFPSPPPMPAIPPAPINPPSPNMGGGGMGGGGGGMGGGGGKSDLRLKKNIRPIVSNDLNIVQKYWNI